MERLHNELVSISIVTEIDKGRKNHPEIFSILSIVPWVEKGFPSENCLSYILSTLDLKVPFVLTWKKFDSLPREASVCLLSFSEVTFCQSEV